MTTPKQSNRAQLLHSIADELGIDPEQVGVLAKGLRSESKIREAVAAHVQSTTEQQSSSATDQPGNEQGEQSEKPKRERKAKLTLSQRRALLRLQDSGQDGVAPASDFKALPYEHLTSVGLAERVDGEGDARASYTLTPSGTARASEINPGYRVWSAGETVAGDPNRPPAGTKRSSQDDEDEQDEAEATDDEPVEIEA